MINIAKTGAGIVTVTDSSYSSLPIIKFTATSNNAVQISKAKGFYQGHYYWELNLPVGETAGSNQYVWFDGTDWYWSSEMTVGAIIFDRIQAAPNTIYPLGTWYNAVMSSSVLISPATGLAKSYFSPTCSYTASSDNNIVYFKINGDYYEIPLSRLQVSGVNPASLSSAISSISTLLTA